MHLFPVRELILLPTTSSISITHIADSVIAIAMPTRLNVLGIYLLSGRYNTNSYRGIDREMIGGLRSQKKSFDVRHFE